MEIRVPIVFSQEAAGGGPQQERAGLPVPVAEGAGQAHGGRAQPGAAQGAAAGGAERGRAAAEDGGAAVPHAQDGGLLHGSRRAALYPAALRLGGAARRVIVSVSAPPLPRGGAEPGRAARGAGRAGRPERGEDEHQAGDVQVLRAGSVPGGKQVSVLARPVQQQVLHRLQVLPEGAVRLWSPLQVRPHQAPCLGGCSSSCASSHGISSAAQPSPCA